VKVRSTTMDGELGAITCPSKCGDQQDQQKEKPLMTDGTAWEVPDPQVTNYPATVEQV
jgi:hypothetical protein